MRPQHRVYPRQLCHLYLWTWDFNVVSMEQSQALTTRLPKQRIQRLRRRRWTTSQHRVICTGTGVLMQQASLPSCYAAGCKLRQHLSSITTWQAQGTLLLTFFWRVEALLGMRYRSNRYLGRDYKCNENAKPTKLICVQEIKFSRSAERNTVTPNEPDQRSSSQASQVTLSISLI